MQAGLHFYGLHSSDHFSSHCSHIGGQQSLKRAIRLRGLLHSTNKKMMLIPSLSFGICYFSLFFVICYFFQNQIFQIFFLDFLQSVKQLGSRSGPTFCRAWSGFKLFAKVQVGKETLYFILGNNYDQISLYYKHSMFCSISYMYFYSIFIVYIFSQHIFFLFSMCTFLFYKIHVIKYN